MRYPFTYPLLYCFAFCAGIIVSLCLKTTALTIPSIIILALVLCVGFFFTRIKAFGFLLIIPVFLIAFAYTGIRNFNEYRFPIEEDIDSVTYFTARVETYEGLRVNRHAHIVTLKEAKVNGTWRRASGNIRLYSYRETPFYPGTELMVRRTIRGYPAIFSNAERDPSEARTLRFLRARSMRGVTTIFRDNDYRVLKEAPRSIRGFYSIIFAARFAIGKNIAKHTTSETYALSRGLLLGDRNAVPSYLNDTFAKAGVAHILAVSGLHVGFILAIVLFILSLLPARYQARLTIAAIIAILFYLPLTLFLAPVARASVMALIAALTLLFDRTRNIINALGIALLLIVAASPNALREASLQLSFAATFGIVALTPLCEYAFERFMPKRFALKSANALYLSVVVSFSALLFTVPLSLRFFDSVNFVSLLSNIILVPIASALVALIVVTAAASPIPFLGALSGALLDGLTAVFIRGAEAFAAIPYLRIEHRPLSAPVAYALQGGLIALGLALALITRVIRAKKIEEGT